MEKSAIKFFKEIEKEQDKYKLVNGLFIVKYLDDDISVLVGEFLKKGSALNETGINKIKIIDSNQHFNKKDNTTTSGLGFWKPLSIKFIERPIKEILKVEI